ncbi:(5-formylfuran-3-yl)methyl phosphate synthase [Methylobacter sp. YRD-M1]|uniref:(5-formylfuran-3-yl)methyl phosphate synthase n=1 Tax=Methylobacter sp. YRD-M1 TaxID=2911520 RepID=UPI00227A10C3|nr:(5-formylfuran-3-yl)methyl phosphate synthase [Methylobacter sp. YRD-M1]WAK04088.1 (5-formylfuran-3-yl)methyl phosphate synthase [Methylobacter sp. YRD-M1]
MTGMLASVNSLDEATLVLDLQADIIDLKQPEQGALGALETELVRQIVTAIGGRRPVSATVGDLPMQPESVFEAVKAMAETGVDYVKIGFFPGGDWPGTLARLSTLSGQHALIAVLFADTQPDLSIIAALKNAGFKGVMLDTMDKQKGSLMQVMNKTTIAQFVAQAKASQLLCGLAGSLRLTDIVDLMPYQADYLGFRGALCRQHNRTAQLDRQAIVRIKRAITDAA